MSRYIILVFFIISSCVSNKERPPVLNVQSGYIERISHFESEYISGRNIDIWLPDNYSEDQKYGLLIMHDGQMLFDSTITWNGQEWGIDEAMTSLTRKNEITPTIIAGIWNTDQRHSEYFPQRALDYMSKKEKQSLLNTQRSEGKPLFSDSLQADNYLKFIVLELIPELRSRYSLHSIREHTFIAGSSMGGLISLYALLEYPGTFASGACLSTHWLGIFTLENNAFPRAMLEYISERLPQLTNHKLYFDYGTETLDIMYEPLQDKVDSLLKNTAQSELTWVTRKFEGANHSEDAWKERVHIPLTFLLSSESDVQH